MKIQIRFVTDEPKYAVPSSELSVPASINSKGLNNLLKGLLEESDTDEVPEFSFIILNDILKDSLEAFFASKEDYVSSTSEGVFEIRYSSKTPPPSPLSSSNHDDWVSSVCTMGSLALSACYDGTLSLWDLSTDTRLLTIPAHGPQPAKSYDLSANEITRVNVGKGHERSVDALASSKEHIASGSFDKLIKLWSPILQDRSSTNQDEEEPDQAKKRKKSTPPTILPLLTLSGHKEAISSLAFGEDSNTLFSSSWDHTIKIWDLSISGMKSELVGNKSFFDISYKDNTVLAASADRFVRIYDARSTASSIVQSTFSSHTGWITSVAWCVDRENLFVSGSHDKLVKMWDSRSYKTPLFDLSGHSERVLCVDWSNRKYILSGGADNDMKVFNSNIL
ncbi:WDR12 [Lepeophtheirus salmonis]|uniref:WDR12 n=1 Tax=Lepeophtheirus salmonis TaxID=72036 RepID=A0A7R8CDN2_LEPSM|nr:WDR12 [Lepeophtheirus salmonis]CAF2782238.1 WDR12 [Lepeophtheirus salmonis]